MSGIIDGRRWLEHRLAHLQARLQEADLSDDDRKAIEAEIVELKAEQSSSRRRFFRWILWGGRPTS